MLGLGARVSSGGAIEEFLPTDISNLSLWFKNDTNVTVGEWADQSGNDNHMTQITSGDQAEKSEGGLLFAAGEGDHYDLVGSQVAITNEEGFTIFLVCKLTSITGNMTILSLNSVDHFLEFRSGADTIRIKLGGTITEISPGDGDDNDFPAGTKFLLTLVREAGGTGNILLYKNGSLLAQDSQAANKLDAEFNSIGVRNNDRFFDGIMHELLVYESALSGDDLANVHNYLTGKFGV